MPLEKSDNIHWIKNKPNKITSVVKERRNITTIKMQGRIYGQLKFWVLTDLLDLVIQHLSDMQLSQLFLS